MARRGRRSVGPVDAGRRDAARCGDATPRLHDSRPAQARRSDRRPNRRRRSSSARLLREIAHVPSPQQVWLVADQPVIVGWAHEAAAFEAAASGRDPGDARRRQRGAPNSRPPQPRRPVQGEPPPAARSTGGDARWLGGICCRWRSLGVLAWMLLRPPAWLPGGASGRDDLTALQHQLDQLATIDPAACHVAVRQ